MDASAAERAALGRLIDANRIAAERFASRASGVAANRWGVSPAEGKWTPAQHAEHVILSYNVATRTLTGEQEPALIGTPGQRMLWRFIGLSQILLLDRLPRGVRAPRDVRPGNRSLQRGLLLMQLRSQIDDFERAFERVWFDSPKRRVNHPYFGAIPLRQAIKVLTVHTTHHRNLLPDA